MEREWRIRGRVVGDGVVHDDGLVVVRGQRISAVEPFTGAGAGEVDLHEPDGWIVPGFVDLQVNGAGGASFSVPGDRLDGVGRVLARDGTTAYLPTIITSPLAEYPALLDAVEALPDRPGVAEALGVHLEGPYLNPSKRGMHRAACIRPPDWNELAAAMLRPSVRVVTLAPERPGAAGVVARLAERGVLVSAGHSAATRDEAAAAFDRGVGWVTHLFNAMSPLHHREPGLPGAALADDRIPVGLIADGVHVHPDVLRAAIRAKGLDRVVVVSDAAPLLGLPDGDYPAPEGTVTVAGATAHLADGTLAGSVVPLLGALRCLVERVGLRFPDAARLMTANPADLVGVGGRKGRLRPGHDADVVVLTADMRPRLVLARGVPAGP